jgi:Flp pilus assembly protein TadD
MEADLKSIEQSMRRGQKLLEDGFAADALEEFDRCLVISPTHADAWYGKAQAYDQMGDNVSATRSRENAERLRAFRE